MILCRVCDSTGTQLRTENNEFRTPRSKTFEISRLPRNARRHGVQMQPLSSSQVKAEHARTIRAIEVSASHESLESALTIVKCLRGQRAPTRYRAQALWRPPWNSRRDTLREKDVGGVFSWGEGALDQTRRGENRQTLLTNRARAYPIPQHVVFGAKCRHCKQLTRGGSAKRGTVMLSCSRRGSRRSAVELFGGSWRCPCPWY